MSYSFFRSLVQTEFMMLPSAAQQYEQIIFSFANNFAFENSSEPSDTIPYNLSSQSIDSSENNNVATEISVHSIRDVMMRENMACGPIGTRTIANRLRESDKEESVFAHIIIFDTPGGAANSVIEISEAIEECTKPVYAWVDGMCCSAGMYAASYCQEIFAHRSTDKVGSIGTMIQFAGRKSGSESEGLFHYRVYAGKSTKKNGWYEAAINNQDITLVKKNLNKLNERFHDDMRTNRPSITEDHLSGDDYEASEVEGALIDGIKTLDELVDHISQQHQPTNSHNNQNQNMAQFPTLNSLLGVPSLESVDGSTSSLSLDQLQAIENALAATPDNSTALANMTQERDNAIAAQTTIQESLDTANLRLEELGEAPGAESAAATTETDSIITESSSQADKEIETIQSAQQIYNELK